MFKIPPVKTDFLCKFSPHHQPFLTLIYPRFNIYLCLLPNTFVRISSSVRSAFLWICWPHRCCPFCNELKFSNIELEDSFFSTSSFVPSWHKFAPGSDEFVLIESALLLISPTLGTKYYLAVLNPFLLQMLLILSSFLLLKVKSGRKQNENVW